MAATTTFSLDNIRPISPPQSLEMLEMLNIIDNAQLLMRTPSPSNVEMKTDIHRATNSYIITLARHILDQSARVYESDPKSTDTYHINGDTGMLPYGGDKKYILADEGMWIRSERCNTDVYKPLK